MYSMYSYRFKLIISSPAETLVNVVHLFIREPNVGRLTMLLTKKKLHPYLGLFQVLPPSPVT